jgi:glycine cleavage system T protein (aminomethyltransferase)
MSQMFDTAPDLKPTPFSPRFADQVSEWVDGFGYAAPLSVSTPEAEYKAVREGVGALDFSMLYKVDVKGRGALELVNGLVTRDLRSLSPGRIAYGAIVDEHGMMVDDVTSIVFSPEFVRVTGGTERLEELLRERAGGTDVRVTQRRAEIGHLCLQGPRSRELLAAVTDDDVSNEAFPYYTYKPRIELAGIPVHLNRLGFTAELGYEVWVGLDRALEVWDALFAVGEPLGLIPVGAIAVMMLRIEAGLIMGDGLEYDSTVSPFECGLGWTIDFEKGDFQGREALADLKDSAPMRLVTVRLAGGGDTASGAPLEHTGEQMGHITMSMPSPHAGATLGLARVKREHAEVGTSVVALIDDGPIEGEIVPMPVYDPDRIRVRS